MRAERRAGQLLRETKEAGQRTTGHGDKEAGQRTTGHGDQKSESRHVTPKPTLGDLGISKKQSSDWQKLAEVDERFTDTLSAGQLSRLWNQRITMGAASTLHPASCLKRSTTAGFQSQVASRSNSASSLSSP